MATNYNLANPDVASAYTTAYTARGNGVQTISTLIELKGKTTNDTFTLCKLPVGAAVLASNVAIVEDAGETCTIDVGYQSGTTTVGQTFVAGFNANQAAGTITAGAGTDLIEGSGIQTSIGTNTLTTANYVGAKVASGSTLAAGKIIVSVVVLFAR